MAAGIKSFVENQNFQSQRKDHLSRLDYSVVDKPIVNLIRNISDLEYCFTLQSCFGHFIYQGQNDEHNLISLPSNSVRGDITYRIAYIAISIENIERGKVLFSKLKDIPFIYPSISRMQTI